MLDFGHSLKKANISLAVIIVIMVGGTLLVGFGASDLERQMVGMVAFVSGYVCLFALYRREDRVRERAEGDTR